MSFLHPEFLYYMLPPLMILFGFLLTQKEAQATFFSDEVMKKLRVTSNTLTLQARNALFMIIGFLIVLALAGPVIKDGKIEIKAKSADIMIALDISDSMLAEDVYPNRLKLAKKKALEFIQQEPNERIGVIAFAKNSYLVSPLSFDHTAVAFLLKKLSTKSITEQGTNLLSMLEVVDNSIKNGSKKYLLILSDGGDDKDFSKEITFAKENKIAVFVLGIGTINGAPIKKDNGSFIKQNGNIIISKLNENIADLATKTGGVYIQSVNSNEDIETMIKEIQKHAQKKELKSQEIARFVPLFYYPLGLALFILLIATSSMSKREKINVPAIFVLLALGFTTPELKAGVFDFMKLEDAKKAYENGEYTKSEKLYSEYASSSENFQSYYNKGNALYKQGKYKEAVQSYEKARFDNKAQSARNFANMGNAYVKQYTKENLQEAVKAYEKSLKIKEDKEVRENLEAVKKALKDQKKKDNKNSKKDKQQKKDNKENQDRQKKDSKDKNKKEKDKQKNKSSKKQSDKNDEKSKNDKNKNDSKSDKEKNKQKQDKKQNKPAKELKNKEKEKRKDVSNANMKQNKNKMSDAEEKKWMKALNANQNSFMYMLNNNNKPVKEDINEKPW